MHISESQYIINAVLTSPENFPVCTSHDHTFLFTADLFLIFFHLFEIGQRWPLMFLTMLEVVPGQLREF